MKITLGDIEYELTNVEQTVRHKCVKIFLDLIILSSLKSRELSGYDVMTVVYDKFHVLLSPGTIYPVLNSLKRQGLVQARPTKRKKVYTLTDKGSTYTDLLSDEY
ncbi:MAG: PadR family transcriptional regulator, partial [Nitrososphaerales archaeon]